MNTTISIQCPSLRIAPRKVICVFAFLLFVVQSIAHAQIHNGSFEFDGHRRNYMVYLPSNYTGSIKLPLVIYLHSYGWTAQRGMDYTQLNQVADTSGFIVVYPSGMPNWNSGVGDTSSPNTATVDDVGFINALIDIVSNSYSIDLERVYACGYSNGGVMAYKLALQLSHRIAAIASVGGAIATYTPESLNPVRPIPVLEIHGTSDTWVPINGSGGRLSVDQTLSIWTNFNNCVQTDTTILPDLDPTDGCTVEKTTYTDCSDNCNVVYYKVINGGHTWPGAGPPGYAAGNTNQDINAGIEIWNFFKNYKLISRPVVDFNGDGIVNINDLILLIECWGTDDWMCDIAPQPFGDGVVDVLDLELLMSYREQEVEDRTLIAHYKLDETEGMTAFDSGGDHDGTVMGVPLWQPDGGTVGGALELDGATFVVAGSVLNPKEGPFSVLAWVKGGAPGQAIISQQAGYDWLVLDPATGVLMTELRSGGRQSKPLYSDAIITDGDWHRVSFTWDGSNRGLYVDDILVAEDTDVALPSCDGGANIGCGKVMAPTTFFTGLIDDVRIYNRAVRP